MREKFLFLILLIGACGVTYGVTDYMAKDSGGSVIIQSTDTTGVIKCNNNITIDETGISTSVGKIYDATVTIESYQNNKVFSTGSGFVYKKDDKYGYIMTNHHVIDNNQGLKITMSNDDVIDGEVLGSDEYLHGIYCWNTN